MLVTDILLLILCPLKPSALFVQSELSWLPLMGTIIVLAGVAILLHTFLSNRVTDVLVNVQKRFSCQPNSC